MPTSRTEWSAISSAKRVAASFVFSKCCTKVGGPRRLSLEQVGWQELPMDVGGLVSSAGQVVPP